MKYQICSNCVMDTSAPEIVFSATGCNFCEGAYHARAQMKYERNLNLYERAIWHKIKEDGVGKKYDCLIGLSGGVDSAYALVMAVQLGLRPLCFSMDNGWNTSNSDENVMRLVEGLSVPFERHVIDLEEFRDLQAAFMRSGVKNIEIPTDHVLMALSLKLATQYGIKYIISGGNVNTESIMPASWGYNARDLVHIKDIYKKFQRKNLRKLPLCGLLKWNWYKWVKGIKTVYLLDYVNYNREEAKALLEEKFGFKDVGEKHEESVFTKWFQNFYLFEKFGIDKRKAHYSSMIVSGQMTRAEAMFKLEANPVYPELGIERKVMKYPKHEHSEYKTDEKRHIAISRFVKTIKRICKS